MDEALTCFRGLHTLSVNLGDLYCSSGCCRLRMPERLLRDGLLLHGLHVFYRFYGLEGVEEREAVMA